MTFAIRLRALRVMRGMSQADLERLTGVPVNVISHMETGKVQPVAGSNWEKKIKAALDWPADESVFGMLMTPTQPKAAA